VEAAAEDEENKNWVTQVPSVPQVPQRRTVTVLSAKTEPGKGRPYLRKGENSGR